MTLDQRPDSSMEVPRDGLFQAEVQGQRCKQEGKLIRQVQEIAIFKQVSGRC